MPSVILLILLTEEIRVQLPETVFYQQMKRANSVIQKMVLVAVCVRMDTIKVGLIVQNVLSS